MYSFQVGKCLLLVLLLNSGISEGKKGLDLWEIMGDAGYVKSQRLQRQMLSSARYGEIHCLPNGRECDNVAIPCCPGMTCVFSAHSKSTCTEGSGQDLKTVPVGYPGYPEGNSAGYLPIDSYSKSHSPRYTRFLFSGRLGIGKK